MSKPQQWHRSRIPVRSSPLPARDALSCRRLQVMSPSITCTLWLICEQFCDHWDGIWSIHVMVKKRKLEFRGQEIDMENRPWWPTAASHQKWKLRWFFTRPVALESNNRLRSRQSKSCSVRPVRAWSCGAQGQESQQNRMFRSLGISHWKRSGTPAIT